MSHVCKNPSIHASRKGNLSDKKLEYLLEISKKLKLTAQSLRAKKENDGKFLLGKKNTKFV